MSNTTEEQIKLDKWKKRMKLWAEDPIHDIRKGNVDAKDYHWGFHAGMCSMAKEAMEVVELLEAGVINEAAEFDSESWEDFLSRMEGYK